MLNCIYCMGSACSPRMETLLLLKNKFHIRWFTSMRYYMADVPAKGHKYMELVSERVLGFPIDIES